MKSNEQQVGGNHYKSAEDKGLPQHWDVAIGMGWSYCIGAATKYIWRLDQKGGPDKAIQDLKKAIHYLSKELEVREAEYALMEKDLADQESYKSVFHGGSFPFGDSLYGSPGQEDSGDANSRYTNQG